MHSECLSPFPLKKPHRIFYHRFLVPASEPFPQTQFGLPNPLQLCPLIPTAAGRMRRTPPLHLKIESLPRPSMTLEGIFTSLCVRSVLVFFVKHSNMVPSNWFPVSLWLIDKVITWNGDVTGESQLEKVRLM